MVIGHLATALTFPKTRQAIRRAKARRRVRVLLWWWLSFAALLAYSLLRGRMDDLGLPVHDDSAERAIFGGLPTLPLQQAIYTRWPEPSEWAAVVVHSSWFFMPGLAALLVSLRRPDRVGSLFRWWIALEALGLVCFALFPMRPPWMTDPGVTRIIALRFGGEIADSNPLAAMPSLHVAFPMMITLWFFRERWKLPALLMLSYTGLVALEVVFSGEHYVVDVLGAVGVAGIVAASGSVDWSLVATRVRTRLQVRRASGPTRLAEPALSPVGDRGQTLIEFAFIAPLIFLFLFVIVDFGIALDRRITLQHAVREGARYGAVATSAGAIQQTTVDQAQDLIDTGDVTVCYEDTTYDANSTPGDVGDAVKVSAAFSYEFPILSELWQAFGGSPLTIDMSPSATGRLELSVPGATACP